MSKFNLTDAPLPNPFSEGDLARDRLEECELRIDDLERSNKLLVQSVTLLMRLCNNKMAAKKSE